jgi:hypothetical protein
VVLQIFRIVGVHVYLLRGHEINLAVNAEAVGVTSVAGFQ